MTSDTAVTWCEEPTLLPHRSTERRAGSQTVGAEREITFGRGLSSVLLNRCRVVLQVSRMFPAEMASCISTVSSIPEVLPRCV
ncbi:unnamed protein product [Knipowitschia caucasica]|uniref:Uncharacterized protein n=1 Tax=Knipowitschia caucasica TaxID=637954 RepID=A0AAV2L2U5_KNICA